MSCYRATKKVCCKSQKMAAVYEFKTKMYKRPNPRPFRTGCFTSGPLPQVLPPGLLCDIVTKMRSQATPQAARKAWTPSIDYRLIARSMDPSLREAYITRCEEWFRDHPPPPPREHATSLVIDTEPIIKILAKYCPNRPPIGEYVKALRAAGYPEERIQKAIDYDRRMNETYEKRTADLELIFAKWPAASKSTPKPKPKVIKAVKKKMN